MVLDEQTSQTTKHATQKITHLRPSLRSKKRSGMIGVMFPRTQIGRTCVIGMPNQIPTGTAPRNSTTGMAEIVAKTAHLGRPKFMKKLAIFCPVCKCSVAALAAAWAGP